VLSRDRAEVRFQPVEPYKLPPPAKRKRLKFVHLLETCEIAMKTKIMLTALAMFLAIPVQAQDIAGTWQGTLHQGQKDARVIATIEKAGNSWKGKFYPLDLFQDWGAFVPIDSVTRQGAELKFEFGLQRGSFQGRLSADGESIDGILNAVWGQGQPLKFERATPKTTWKDPSQHTVQFVTVEDNVKLEVLDWGGAGRPLVFIPGGGATAHNYDIFAPKFISKYHVYGITPRGFGASSAPTLVSAYTSTRLGDDVIAVLDALKIERPVLVGQSIAGETLSSVGSRHPERVAGLIYLDAAYPYAFYDAGHGDIYVDLRDLKQKLEQLEVGKEPPDPRPLLQELLTKDLPGFERDLRDMQTDLEADPPSGQPDPPLPLAIQAMFQGMDKYTSIPVPVLAIYAVPHDVSRISDPKLRAASEARDLISTGRQADAFEKGVPTARVVRWPHAKHNLVKFHEADVIREMNAFLSSLK
jgi:pimeloyl-ACP methyl ester carboxylesterase